MTNFFLPKSVNNVLRPLTIRSLSTVVIVTRMHFTKAILLAEFLSTTEQDR